MSRKTRRQRRLARQALAAAKPPLELFQQYIRSLVTKGAATRIREMRQLLASMDGQLLREKIESAKNAAKGFAKELLSLPAVERQLATTPQFGTLASLAGPATRLDYVLTHCQVILQFKEAYPGLGFGSAPPKFEGKNHGFGTFLELAQTWAVLTSLGHLFGTFTTERALMYELRQHAELERSFLALIPENLRAAVDGLVREDRSYDFFYALAAYRTISLPTERFQRMAKTALQLFFELVVKKENHSKNHALLFRRTREIAWNRLHSKMGTPAVVDGVWDDNFVARVLPEPEILFDKVAHDKNDTFKYLKAVAAYETSSLFESEKAGKLDLAHLHEFKTWWKKRDVNKVNLAATIDSLFESPADWPNPDERPLRSFAVLNLPTHGRQWPKLVKDWRDAGNVWGESTFLVNPRPGAPDIRFEIFVSTQGLAPATATHVASRIAQLADQTWTTSGDKERRQEFWRSKALFGLRLFRSLLRPEFSVTLEPANAKGNHRGFAIIAPKCSRALEVLRELTPKLEEESRRRELEGVRTYLQEAREYTEDAPFLLMLGIVRVVDRLGHPAKEFDGLWCAFKGDEIRWGILEHKGGSETPETDLGQKMAVFRYDFSKPARVKVGSGKAAVVEFSWRGEGPLLLMQSVRPEGRMEPSLRSWELAWASPVSRSRLPLGNSHFVMRPPCPIW